MTTNTNDKAQYHWTHWEGEFPTLLNTFQYQPYRIPLSYQAVHYTRISPHPHNFGIMSWW